MIQTTDKSKTVKPKDANELKDDAFAQKGRTKHIVETDWPTKESVPTSGKRKAKKTENARLP